MKDGTEVEKVEVSKSTITQEQNQKIGNETKEYARIHVQSFPLLFLELFRLINGHEADGWGIRLSKIDTGLPSTESGSDVGELALDLVLRFSKWDF